MGGREGVRIASGEKIIGGVVAVVLLLSMACGITTGVT